MTIPLAVCVRRAFFAQRGKLGICPTLGLAAMTLVVFCPPLSAAALRVTNSGDNGPNTLRAAVSQFATSDAEKILIRVREIELTEQIRYTGARPLVIESTNGVRIVQTGGSTALSVTAPGLSLRGMTFEYGGIKVTVPKEINDQPVVGEIYLNFEGVSIWHVNGTGLRVSDGSAAHLGVWMARGDIYFNNWGAFISKRGGPLTVHILGMRVVFNGANGNADGMQITQSGPGDNRVFIGQSAFGYNSEDAFDLEESGDGDLRVAVLNFIGLFSGEDSMDFTEEGNGGIYADIRYAWIGGYRNDVDCGELCKGRGIDFQENGDGPSVISIMNTLVEKCEWDGVRIRAGGAGNVAFSAQNLTIKETGVMPSPDREPGPDGILGTFDDRGPWNSADGFDFQATGNAADPFTGYSDIRFRQSTITHNTQHGILVEAAHTPLSHDGRLDIANDQGFYLLNGNNLDHNNGGRFQLVGLARDL